MNFRVTSSLYLRLKLTKSDCRNGILVSKKDKKKYISTHLSESYDPLFGTHDTSLQHQIVVPHDSIVRKPSLQT